MCALAALLVLAQALPVAAAQEPQAVWWGETAMNEGWHLRIPLRVQNPLPFTIYDASVGTDVNVTQALADAGWPMTSQGSLAVPRAFALITESFRVIEYRALGTTSVFDGTPLEEVPSRVFPGTFDDTRAFDSRNHPDVHLQWVIPGELRAQQTRYFMIQFDTAANGAKAAPEYEAKRVAPLDARYWSSRGTTLYGAAAALTIHPLAAGTNVSIDVYQNGRAYPLSSALAPNPIVLEGEPRTVALGDTPVPVRVRADKPVMVQGHVSAAQAAAEGGGSGADWVPAPVPRLTGPIPSIDGGVMGRRFAFIDHGPGYIVLSPSGAARVTIGTSAPVTVSPSSPHLVETSWSRTLVEIQADAPIQVIPWPSALGKTQLVSTLGTPAGASHAGVPFAQKACKDLSSGQRDRAACPAPPPCTLRGIVMRSGEVVVASLGGAGYARARDLITGKLRLPVATGGTASEFAAPVLPATPWRGGVPDTNFCPLLVHASARNETTIVDDARHVVFGGLPGKARMESPIGGEAAMTFYSEWPVWVVPFHNGTFLDVQRGDEGVPTPGLARGDLVAIDADLGDAHAIRSSKPVAVLPRTAGWFFVGVDESLRVEAAGRPEYRGFLFALRPVGNTTEPIVKVTGPNVPVTFAVEIENLAKDHAGRYVQDSVELVASGLPDGWTLTAPEQIALGAHEKRRLEVVVQPPPDAAEGARASLELKATSGGNPRLSDSLRLIVVIRAAYDIGLWFEREGGSTVATLAADPGTPVKATMVLKNKALVRDRVLVALHPFSAEWEASFLDGQARMDVQLEPLEARTIEFNVVPPRDLITQSLLEVVATSYNSAAAAAKLTAMLRVRANVSFDVSTTTPLVEAKPGEVATFPITITNNGQGSLSLAFNLTGAHPDGWVEPRVTRNGHALGELSGIAPGASVVLSVEVPIAEAATWGTRLDMSFRAETLPFDPQEPIERQSIDLFALVAYSPDLAVVSASEALVLVPGEEALVEATIANRGNANLTLWPEPSSLPSGVGLDAEPTTAQAGATARLQALLRAAPDALPGRQTVQLDIISDQGDVLSWELEATVTESAAARLEWTSPSEGVAGEERIARVRVSNTGNVPLALPPALDRPTAWTLGWGLSPGLLAPGSEVSLDVVVRPPREAPEGAQALRGSEEWASSNDITWTVRAVRLRIEEASLDDGGSLHVLVRNDGTAEGRNVSVALRRGDVVVDQARLPRVPPGDAVPLLLHATAGGALTLRIDEEETYGAVVIHDIASPPDTAKATPGVGVWGVVLAMAAGAMRRIHNNSPLRR